MVRPYRVCGDETEGYCGLLCCFVFICMLCPHGGQQLCGTAPSFPKTPDNKAARALERSRVGLASISMITKETRCWAGVCITAVVHWALPSNKTGSRGGGGRAIPGKSWRGALKEGPSSRGGQRKALHHPAIGNVSLGHTWCSCHGHMHSYMQCLLTSRPVIPTQSTLLSLPSSGITISLNAGEETNNYNP